MTEKPKNPLTETAFDRKMDQRIKALQEAQEKRDAAQDAKLDRPSRAMKAVSASLDITEKYPLASWCVGVALVVLGLLYLDGPKLYIACGIGVCFVPGLARKVVGLASGLKKAKGDE